MIYPRAEDAADTKTRQRAIARAWLDGFAAYFEETSCPQAPDELLRAWEAGYAEARERGSWLANRRAD